MLGELDVSLVLFLDSGQFFLLICQKKTLLYRVYKMRCQARSCLSEF